MVEAAEDFVRVVVRRPHAYSFIQDLFAGRGGLRSATIAGVTIADGSSAPIPGIYLLDSEGGFIESVHLKSATARDDLLEAMTREDGS